MSPNATRTNSMLSVASDDEVRVIPRPSQRRRSTALAGVDGTLDLRDAAPRRGKPAMSSPKNAEPQDSGFRATFLTLGTVSALGAGVAYGMLGLSGKADSTLGMVVAPVLAVIATLLINRWVTPKLGPALGAVFIAGFGVRLAASVPRFLGGADSPIYQREGVRIADELLRLNFGVDTGRTVPGTGTIRYLSGVVNVLTGSTYIATFLLFATVAFVGQCFFLFAMRPALNNRQFRLLCLAVMFSPTLAFWPSSIGKESLSLLGIGLGAYGAALLYDRRWKGVPYVVLGSVAVGMVRPHVALILLAGLFVGLMARRAHTRGRMLTHLALLLIVIVGTMAMTGASADLFGLESFDGVSDVSAALDFAQERTSQDAAQFVAARVSSPLDYPWAFVTVLFRPFPWEAGNAASMISALESAALFTTLLVALPGVARQGNQFVQRGQLLYTVAFTAVFIYLFSAIGNFGILSRQRAQVIPFLLVVLAFGLGVEKRQERRA